MALSLARSPSPGAALPAPRVAHFALPLLPLRSPRRQYQALRLRLRVAASSPPEAQAAAPFAEEGEEQGEKRRKLYVANLPWSFPAPEIEKLFAQHGTVKDVEVRVGSATDFRERNAVCSGEPLRPRVRFGCPPLNFQLRYSAFCCVCLVKVIKGKDGRNRGFAFVTMSTAEEAAAAAEKLNSHVSALMVALMRMRLVCTML
jgi:RNA recognition motif-containing protein